MSHWCFRTRGCSDCQYAHFMDRQTFEKIVRNKAIIGMPFTLEDVAETGKCKHPMSPVCDCKATPVPTAWLQPLVQSGVIHKVGEVPSSNPTARGRKVSLWGGGGRVEVEEEELVA